MENYDIEMTNHMKACAKNLADEVAHLKEFLEDKDEDYILCNPEEVANELISSGLSAAHMIGGYNILSGIRETGMVPRISFQKHEESKISDDNKTTDDFNPCSYQDHDVYKVMKSGFKAQSMYEKYWDLNLAAKT